MKKELTKFNLEMDLLVLWETALEIRETRPDVCEGIISACKALADEYELTIKKAELSN